MHKKPRYQMTMLCSCIAVIACMCAPTAALAAKATTSWSLPTTTGVTEDGGYLLVAFPIETIQSYPGQIEEAMLDFRTSSSFPQDCIAFVRCDPSTESLEGESFPSTGSPARGLRTVCAYSTDGVQKRFRIPLRTLLQGVQSGDITAGGLLIGSMSENGKCARLTTEALESLTNDETAWSAMVTIWSIRKDTEDEE